MRSADILFGPGGPCQNPRHRSEAKIPYRGPRLVGTWLNWRLLPGIRFTIQRIEFLSQLSTPTSFRPLTPPFSFIYRVWERFVSNPRHDLNAAAAFSVNKSNLEFKFNYGSAVETDIRVFSSGGRISCRIFLAFLKGCSKIRLFFFLN